MAITPNYSWPIPDDTDLVKDGAEAIRDLGNAIDTTVDGLPSGGLVHIKTDTFSSVSGIDVDNCFTTNFDVYEIVCNVETSVSTVDVFLRLRAGGSTNSSSQYERQLGIFTGSTTSIGRDTVTFFNFGGANENRLAVNARLFYPASTARTSFNAQGKDSSATFAQLLVAAQTTVTTAYDGYNISLGSGTMTGTITIFGYKK